MKTGKPRLHLETPLSKASSYKILPGIGRQWNWQTKDPLNRIKYLMQVPHIITTISEGLLTSYHQVYATEGLLIHSESLSTYPQT